MEVLQSNSNGNGAASDTRDTLFLLGGVSMMVFGAGLILTSPLVRQMLGGAGVGNMIQAAVPDIQRYLKLKAM
jgi:hypothetical protein